MTVSAIMRTCVVSMPGLRFAPGGVCGGATSACTSMNGNKEIRTERVSIRLSNFRFTRTSNRIYKVPHNYLKLRFVFQPAKAVEKFSYACSTSVRQAVKLSSHLCYVKSLVTVPTDIIAVLFPMKLTDTHCHLDFNKFDEDREAVIQRAIEAGVSRMLIPALDLDSGLAGLKLAEAHPFIFAAVGFHPTELDKWTDSAIEDLRALIMESSGLPLQ